MDSASGGTASGGTGQLPSVGTSLSSAASVGAIQFTDILPSPAWSRGSRRRRVSIPNTFIAPHDYTVSLDHVTRSDSTVSLDHVIRSVYTVSLDHVTKESSVPLDLCSPRSVIPVPLDLIKKSSHDVSLVIDSSADAVPLGLDKKLPAMTDDYDSELEVSES